MKAITKGLASVGSARFGDSISWLYGYEALEIASNVAVYDDDDSV